MNNLLPRIMTLDEFTPLVGYTFIAECDPAPIGITLVEASALRKNLKLERPPFILIFRSPLTAQLIAGAYVLRCGEWGPGLIDLNSLIAPQGGQPGYYYQAIFS